MVRALRTFNLKDCLREGLLRKTARSREKAWRSIEIAKKWLEEAEKNINNGAFNSSLISSYLAMFHSARAILFLDGFREKSHYCIARYLEEHYVKKGILESKWVGLLDHYRELRHSGQYSLGFLGTKEEAAHAIKAAKEFTEKMKNLLENLERK